MDKPFRLDYNHAPNFVTFGSLREERLRSGDIVSIELLTWLDSFFARELGYKKAGFFDFSPCSIALFIQKIAGQNAKIALSSKLSYFCIEAAKILKAQGADIVWVAADKDGYLSKESLAKAAQSGADYLVCSIVDEDSFLVENMDAIYEYFGREKIIADISNAVKKIDTDKYAAAFFWGYKLGSFKRSGVYLCGDPALEMLDSIDLSVYAHLKEAFCAYDFNVDLNIKNSFIASLKNTLKDDFSTFIDLARTLDNAVYCRFADIKARDFIRALALDGIFTTNGELCSLGLSKPSRILQTLGYGEDEAREALSISFDPLVTPDEADFLAEKIGFRYRQIRAILG